MMDDLRFRLRALFRRSEMDRNLDDELEFHLDHAIDKYMRDGFSRAEARLRANRELGGVDRIREATREVRGVGHIERIVQDLRFGWRSLRAHPGSSAVLVLTLGIGIAASATMFGIVDRLFLRAPAYMNDAHRVHRLYVRHVAEGTVFFERSLEYWRYSALRQAASADVAAFAARELPVGSGDNTRELQVLAASASFLEFFDARPALGRVISEADDDAPRSEPVAVLGYAYWKSQFGGTDVLGQPLLVGDATYTIVGVAPEGFNGMPDLQTPAVIIPLTAFAHTQLENYEEDYGYTWLEVVLRRRPEVSLAVADADVQRRFAATAERQVVGAAAESAELRPRSQLAPIHLGRGPQASLDATVAVWVAAVSILVLLIACSNVVNLLLARAMHRRHEIALRLALGITRSRLLQQLLTEALLLAALGAVTGLLLAHWGGNLLRVLFLPHQAGGSILSDGRTVLVTIIISLGVAVVTGVAPAAYALRPEIAGDLAGGSRTANYTPSRLRSGLLGLQVAMSVVLLVGAGLFGSSMLNAERLRLGYDVEPTLYVQVALRGITTTRPELMALMERLEQTALTIPGVASASWAVSLPFRSAEGRGAPLLPGRDSVEHGTFTLQAGSPHYFETVGTRIRRGRGFRDNDVPGSMPVVVVSQSMAAALWPGREPLGQQMRIGGADKPTLTVVGVAEDVRGKSVSGPPEHWYYLPLAQHTASFGGGQRVLFVRASRNAEDVAETVRQRLQREMPSPAYVNVVPLRAVVDPQQRAWKFGATMFIAFAGIALLLGAIGLYGSMAYAVAQRTKEFGVRLALGATGGTILRMVLGHGLMIAAGGTFVGLLSAVFAARFVEPVLLGISPYDVDIYSSVVVLIFLVAGAASLVPAIRAVRVDALAALRNE